MGWAEWQREHEAALRALQLAQQAYHRAVAGNAFATPGDLATGLEAQRECLEQVDAARARLDDVRARRPE